MNKGIGAAITNMDSIIKFVTHPGFKLLKSWLEAKEVMRDNNGKEYLEVNIFFVYEGTFFNAYT